MEMRILKWKSFGAWGSQNLFPQVRLKGGFEILGFWNVKIRASNHMIPLHTKKLQLVQNFRFERMTNWYIPLFGPIKKIDKNSTNVPICHIAPVLKISGKFQIENMVFEVQILHIWGLIFPLPFGSVKNIFMAKSYGLAKISNFCSFKPPPFPPGHIHTPKNFSGRLWRPEKKFLAWLTGDKGGGGGYKSQRWGFVWVRWPPMDPYDLWEAGSGGWWVLSGHFGSGPPRVANIG